MSFQGLPTIVLLCSWLFSDCLGFLLLLGFYCTPLGGWDCFWFSFLSLWMGLFLDCCCIDKYNQINYFWNVKYCQKVNISKNARILYIKGSLIWMIILLINLTKFNFELIVNLQNPMQFLLKCQLILTFLMQLRVIPEGHLFLQFLVFVKLGFVKF